MASAEHEPITRVWEQTPQRGPAGSRELGGRSPPEAESIMVTGCPTEPANLAPVRENSMLCYGPLVSELGGPECMVPPNPVIWGPVPPPGSAAYGHQPRVDWSNPLTLAARMPVIMYILPHS